MSTINFPYQNRPRHLKDVAFQEVAVTTVKSWLAADSIPSSIFVCGPTGVGKTLIAKLLIQATHCLNRSAGETETCGICAVCKSDPQFESGYGNVIWVAAQNSKDADNKEITYQAAVIDALHQADRGPLPTGRAHADILYIVFEEAHLLPKHLFQRCLSRSDAFDPFTGNVVLVFITMSAEQLDDKARQAVSQRGAILELSRPKDFQIASYLRHKFHVSNEVSDLLATASNGSLRGALSNYKDCLDFIQPLTVESVRLRLGVDVSSTVRILWEQILRSSSAPTFRQEVSNALLNKSIELCIEKLQLDLDDNYKLLGDDLWWAATLILAQVVNNPNKLSFVYSLLNLRSLTWPPAFLKNINAKYEPSIFARILQEPWEDLHYGS